MEKLKTRSFCFAVLEITEIVLVVSDFCGTQTFLGEAV